MRDSHPPAGAERARSRLCSRGHVDLRLSTSSPVLAPPRPRLTIAICTHNRCEYLRFALESLVRQSADPRSFEVLVVDNASSDATASVAASMALRLEGRLRCVREDRLGLSHARNRALQETDAPYIAYLDDDAIAEPQWVHSLLAAFEGAEPRPVAVGGPVRPIWLTPRPVWVGERLDGSLTIIDWHGEARCIDGNREYLCGANMAFERAAVVGCGGFDAELGRIGSKLLGGEEMLLQRRLAWQGGSIYYEPAAGVRHHVHPERLDRRWFYRRFYWDGVSCAIREIRLRSLTTRQRWRLALRSAVLLLWRGRLHDSLLADSPTRFATRLEALRTMSTVFWLMRSP